MTSKMTYSTYMEKKLSFCKTYDDGTKNIEKKIVETEISLGIWHKRNLDGDKWPNDNAIM